MTSMARSGPPSSFQLTTRPWKMSEISSIVSWGTELSGCTRIEMPS